MKYLALKCKISFRIIFKVNFLPQHKTRIVPFYDGLHPVTSEVTCLALHIFFNTEMTVVSFQMLSVKCCNQENQAHKAKDNEAPVWL